MTLITLHQGDITLHEVDAIVNAANWTLLGGGGVDGAIHHAAGPGLFDECSKLGGCNPGEAKITGGHDLPAKRVIHTVGPEYGREEGREAKLLASCYINSLTLAKEHNLKSIAFPAISTGAFGYPPIEAAKIALEAVRDFSKTHPNVLGEIRFVVFSDEGYLVYKELLENSHFQ